jgi:hypothetical protein
MVGLATASLGQTQLSVAAATDLEHVSRDYVAACLDEAIIRLKRDSGYAGLHTVPIGDGTCTLTVSGAGSSRTVSVTATSGFYTKNVTAALTQSAAGGGTRWTVSSWQETVP